MRMGLLRPLVAVVGLATFLACSSGGSDSPAELPDPEQLQGGDPKGATETNVAPAPCDADADCPEPMRCVPLMPGEAAGRCMGGADAGQGSG